MYVFCLSRKGILYRHAIVLLIEWKFDYISTWYTLDRWRKNVSREHTFFSSHFGELKGKLRSQQFDRICNPVMEIAKFSAESEDNAYSC